MVSRLLTWERNLKGGKKNLWVNYYEKHEFFREVVIILDQNCTKYQYVLVHVFFP